MIKNLNASKAHGWDKISIRMIKLCGKTIAIKTDISINARRRYVSR